MDKQVTYEQGRKFNKNICIEIFDMFRIQYYNKKISPKMNLCNENSSEKCLILWLNFILLAEMFKFNL
jgi:hypothetical protein